MQKVKTFLDANPNEVLTLLFTNPEGQNISTVWKPAFDAAGITPLAYVPPSVPVKQSDWPTLGQLIDSGKRVVVFLDSGTDTSQVNFILPEFEMACKLHPLHLYLLLIWYDLCRPTVDMGDTV